MKIWSILMVIFCLQGPLHARIAPLEFYQTYKSLAEPLYCPWLADPVFLEIQAGYPEGLPNSSGRYFQYSLARHAVSLEADGDFIECGVCTGKSLDIFASVIDRFDHKNGSSG